MATPCSLPVMDSCSTRVLWRERSASLDEEEAVRGVCASIGDAAATSLLSRRPAEMERSFMAGAVVVCEEVVGGLTSCSYDGGA